MDAENAVETAEEALANGSEEFIHPVMAFLTGLVEPGTFIERIGSVVVVIILAVIVYTIARRAFDRSIRQLESNPVFSVGGNQKRTLRAVTLISLADNIIKWTILLGAFIWILAIAGVNLVPILTGAGIAGVAVAFGAQALVRDFMTGFFLLLEGQYGVGDYVQIGPNFGQVKAVGLRVTVLQDLDNRIHYIPNGGIMAVTVYEEQRVHYIIKLVLAEKNRLNEAVAEVSGLLADAAAEFPRYLLHYDQPQVINGEARFAGIQVGVQVFPTQDWLAQEEIPQRIQKRLEALEITVPEGIKPRIYLDPAKSLTIREVNNR